MAGDKTYITDSQGKLHRATRVHAVTPTDIVWSSNPNDYSVQVKVGGKWHRAILTMDAGAAQFFDNININKALVTGADGKQHTALIVKPESTVTLSDIKTDTHGTIAGTTTGETAVSTYSENWSDVKWQDNVNVYKVLVTGSDGKVHTALLTTSAGGGVQAIVMGVAPLSLPDAIANSLSYVKAFGGTEQNGTPTPDAPMDIVSNNGVLKYGVLSTNLLNLANCTDGYYYTPTGEYTSTPNARLSNYIPVKAGVTYTVGLTGTEGQSNVRINLFDTAKNWLSQTVFVSYTNEKRTQSITPAQDGFLAFSANFQSTSRVDWNTAQVVQGSYTAETMPEYEPYREGVYADGTVETIQATGKNLYNKENGVLFGCPTGNYTWYQKTDASSELTIMVRLKEGSTYTATRADGSNSTFRIQASATPTLTRGQSLVEINSTGTSAINTKTFTVPYGAPYVLFYVRNTNSQSSLTVDDVINAFQVELGSTATEYAPYYDGGTATAEMLLKVGNYQDVQSILDGVVTRNIGIKVLDGTEDWSRTNVRTLLELPDSAIGSRDWAPYCTHYQGFLGSASISSMPDNSCKINVNTNQLLIKDETHNTDITTWKQWLADQYAAGTPVIVVYPLATPTTESVAGQTLQVTGGDNIVEITQASLSGLELEAKYEKVA